MPKRIETCDPGWTSWTDLRELRRKMGGLGLKVQKTQIWELYIGVRHLCPLRSLRMNTLEEFVGKKGQGNSGPFGLD